MCIDTNAGIRHAAQLLQDGAEIEGIRSSLGQYPPKFAEGVRRVIDDPVVLVELMKIRAGFYNPPQNPLPELPSMGYEEPPRNKKHSPYTRPGNPYPGLNEFHRNGNFRGWQVRRMQDGVEYRSRIFKEHADAVKEWKRLDAELQLLATSPEGGS